MMKRWAPYALALAASLSFAADAPTKPARLYNGLLHECPSLSVHAASRVAKVASYDTFYVASDSKFIIHYDTTGTNQVPLEDESGSGTPDWIEMAAHIADSVLSEYGKMGYETHLNVGEDTYPIYLKNISYYGYAMENPPQLIIDNDFSQSYFESQGLDGMRVTIAHELFHAVQFQYVEMAYYSSIGWWMEMTATFMEEIMYDDVNDYYQYIDPDGWGGNAPSIYGGPHLGLNRFHGIYPYSGAVFPIYLMERYGRDEALDIIRDSFVVGPATTSGIVNTIVSGTGTGGINEVLAEFWTWSYFTGTRAIDGKFFTEGAHYRPPPLDTTVYAGMAAANTVVGLSDSGMVSRIVGANGLGAVLQRVVPDGSPGGFSATFATAGDTVNHWSWRVVIRSGDDITVFSTPSQYADTTWSVDVTAAHWSDATDVLIVGANGSLSGTQKSFRYTLDYDAVSDVNRPPVWRPLADTSVHEGVELVFIVSAYDPDGDNLDYDTPVLPMGAVFTDSTFRWTPMHGQAGDTLAVFSVTDGEYTVLDTVYIEVIQVNRPPIWYTRNDTSTLEGKELVFVVSAYDPDGDSLVYDAPILPLGAVFTDSTFRWTPTHDQLGDTMAVFSVYDGKATVLDTVLISVAGIPLPSQVRLGQNYPNPFNPSTNIPVDLPEPGHMTLAVYDVSGRLVATLAEGHYPAGTHRFVWDATTATGLHAGAGVYIVRLTAGETVHAQRMLLAR